MNISKLIDEILCFELTDEVTYLNLEIATKGDKWNLTKTEFSEFTKWTPELGDDRPQNSTTNNGIDANVK